MKQVFDWVDSNPKDADHQFSGRRVLKLFIALIVLGIVVTIPYILLEWAIESHEEAKAKRKQEVEIRRTVDEALEEGTAGEATKRLFGIEEGDSEK